MRAWVVGIMATHKPHVNCASENKFSGVFFLQEAHPLRWQKMEMNILTWNIS